MIHTFVNSDWFTLAVGVAGIVAAVAAVTAVSKINTIIIQSNKDSNIVGKQTQTITGNNNAQAGRDSNQG